MVAARYLARMKNLHMTVLLLFVAILLPGCQTHEHVVLVSVQEDAAESPIQFVSKSTRSAANALLAAMTDEQKKLAQYDIKAPLRKDWHFIPRERKGLPFGDMTNEQKTLVHKLMQTALSDSGYLKATDIIWLESVLYELSNQRPMRSPNNYVIQIYGDPADEKAAWGWRLEGHHLSINLTYTSEGIGLTPLFYGTNPAVVQQGPLAGKRVLADPHNLAVEFAKSLSEEQLKKMMLDQKPRDVVTAPGREASLKDPVGLSVESLNDEQVTILIDLIDSYVFDFEADHAMKLDDYFWDWEDEDDVVLRDNIHLAWAGPADVDEPFYYRIHTPEIVIEYSCQGKNHVHAVIHDLTDPLQEDLLKKHFEKHEHE